VRPNHKSRGNKRQGNPPIGRNLEARNREEGRGIPNQGEEWAKEKMKSWETSEQETRKNTENPNNKGDLRGNTSPMEGGNEDANTPMKEVNEDAEMTPRKVGT
jgi:hypothetical protein